MTQRPLIERSEADSALDWLREARAPSEEFTEDAAAYEWLVGSAAASVTAAAPRVPGAAMRGFTAEQQALTTDVRKVVSERLRLMEKTIGSAASQVANTGILKKKKNELSQVQDKRSSLYETLRESIAVLESSIALSNRILEADYKKNVFTANTYGLNIEVLLNSGPWQKSGHLSQAAPGLRQNLQVMQRNLLAYHGERVRFRRFDHLFSSSEARRTGKAMQNAETVEYILTRIAKRHGVTFNGADLKAQLAQESGDFSIKDDHKNSGGFMGIGQQGQLAMREAVAWMAANLSQELQAMAKDDPDKEYVISWMALHDLDALYNKNESQNSPIYLAMLRAGYKPKEAKTRTEQVAQALQTIAAANDVSRVPASRDPRTVPSESIKIAAGFTGHLVTRILESVPLDRFASHDEFKKVVFASYNWRVQKIIPLLKKARAATEASNTKITWAFLEQNYAFPEETRTYVAGISGRLTG